jgi:hypothetical protein
MDQDDIRILIAAWATTLANKAKAGSLATAEEMRKDAERLRILCEQLKD